MKAKSKFRDIFKIGDILVLVVIIVAIVLTVVFATTTKANRVEIYINDRLYQSADIATDAEIEILDGKMVVKIENGQVFVKHSDCKNQICVHQHPIDQSGGMIVCLPHHVVIKLSDSKVDAVT